MIIIVSTPLRIAASYVLAFAAGAVLTCRWRIGRNPIRSPSAESTPSLWTSIHPTKNIPTWARRTD